MFSMVWPQKQLHNRSSKFSENGAGDNSSSTLAALFSYTIIFGEQVFFIPMSCWNFQIGVPALKAPSIIPLYLLPLALYQSAPENL